MVKKLPEAELYADDEVHIPLKKTRLSSYYSTPQLSHSNILETPFLQLSEEDTLTLRQACEGIHIFGGTGSGKTSGSGQTIAMEFLSLGMGGLVLTAKPEELETWQDYMERAGRSDDLVIFDLEHPYRFNFMDYEFSREGAGAGLSINIVDMLLDVAGMKGEEDNSGNNSYFIHAARRMLTNAVDFCMLGHGRVYLRDIVELIQTAPRTDEELDPKNKQHETFIKGFCFETMARTSLREKVTLALKSPKGLEGLIKNHQATLEKLGLDYQAKLKENETKNIDNEKQKTAFNYQNTLQTLQKEDNQEGIAKLKASFLQKMNQLEAFNREEEAKAITARYEHKKKDIEERHPEKIKPLSDLELQSLQQIKRYWLEQFRNEGGKNTLNSIISTLLNVTDMFQRGALYELFCTETNITPEDSFKGKVIVVNLPIQEYRKQGEISQQIFKTIWQYAIQRRKVEQDTLPAFLWVDEAQLFLTQHDQEFVTTARSARSATVFLSQNYPNYLARLGNNQPVVQSLLGNFQTKIFHQNTDVSTNEWASSQIGKVYEEQTSTATQVGRSEMGQNTGQTLTKSLVLREQVLGSEFTTLKKGGPVNDLEVEACIISGGQLWKANNKNYMFVSFQQPERG